MSKQLERMNFEWQKANNHYVLLLTIILFLASSMNLIPNNLKKIAAGTTFVTILLFGLAMITLRAKEFVYYWQGLRDKRTKVPFFERYFSICLYLFECLMGLIVFFFAIYILFFSGIFFKTF
jgi:hypothetical protein